MRKIVFSFLFWASKYLMPRRLGFMKASATVTGISALLFFLFAPFPVTGFPDVWFLPKYVLGFIFGMIMGLVTGALLSCYEKMFLDAKVSKKVFSKNNLSRCPKCGYGNESDSSFCGKCGYKF